MMSGMLEYRKGFSALLIGMISRPTGMYASFGISTPVTKVKYISLFVLSSDYAVDNIMSFVELGTIRVHGSKSSVR